MRHILAPLALVALTAPSAAELGVVRTFNDWVVGCDNTRYCRALGFAFELDPQAPVLAIARQGRADAQPDVLLIWSDSPPNSAITLSAGAETLGVIEPDKDLKENEGEGGGHRIVNEPIARAILAKLRSVPAFEVKVAGSNDPPFQLSLKGASAALLFMDDRQKRVGTVTALVRPGDKAASTIPAPPKAAVLPAPRKVAGKPVPEEAPPAVRRLFLSEAAKACDLEGDEARKSTAYLAARLTATDVLYAMQCWRAAYNFGAAFYIFREGPGGGTARRAELPQPIERDSKEKDRPPNHVLSNAEFDEETLEVSSFHKGRGIGDCGDAYQWRWVGDRFVPAGAGLMPACRGLVSENWLQLYRVEGRKGPTIE